MMRRREFIAGLCAAAWPAVAGAQQSDRTRRIAILWPNRESDPVRAGFDAALRTGLAELGWVQGRNLQIDARYAAGESPEKVGALIKELVDFRPEILATGTVRLTRALQEQTRTIPIVMMGAGDPLASGLVKSLSRPEANTTGITDIFPSLGSKWLELLTQCAPRLERVALLVNPDRSSGSILRAAKDAASSGVKVIETQVRSAEDIEHSIVGFAAKPRGGLIIVPPPFLPSERQLINRLAVEYRLPVIYQDRAFAVEGGLLSYGADLLDMHRRGVPPYIDRILRGASPRELPVQFPTKFSLVLNLKTANAMSLIIPSAFLSLADEVIE
jgi:putative tryptophan/tyrosine transport system substrate-binding protein